jgi:hypothetical protein
MNNESQCVHHHLLTCTITVFNLMLNNPPFYPSPPLHHRALPRSTLLAAMVDFKHQKSWFYDVLWLSIWFETPISGGVTIVIGCNWRWFLPIKPRIDLDSPVFVATQLHRRIPESPQWPLGKGPGKKNTGHVRKMYPATCSWNIHI